MPSTALPAATMNTAVPRLRPGVRLSYDAVRGCHVLLHPEGVLIPNDTASAVLVRCDGQSSIATIVEELREVYEYVDITEVTDLLRRLAADQLLTLEQTNG